MTDAEITGLAERLEAFLDLMAKAGNVTPTVQDAYTFSEAATALRALLAEREGCLATTAPVVGEKDALAAYKAGREKERGHG